MCKLPGELHGALFPKILNDIDNQLSFMLWHPAFSLNTSCC
jgi:hypothetical protein